MPKKSQKPTLVPLSARIPAPLSDEIDRYRDSLELDRSSATRVLLTMGLSYYSQLDELAHELKIAREENRQLAALLFANLPHDKDFDPKTIPEIIRLTVEHAEDLVNSEREG